MVGKLLSAWILGGVVLSVSAAELVLAKRGEKPSFTIITREPAAATGRYEWYDFGEWTDEGHPLILHVDLRGATCAIDSFEISAAGEDK